MTYPALSHFLGCWLHYFDTERESVLEKLEAFRAVTPADEQRKLKLDIQRFLDAHPRDVDSAFEATFKADVFGLGPSGTTRPFLEEIRDLLDPRAT